MDTNYYGEQICRLLPYYSPSTVRKTRVVVKDKKTLPPIIRLFLRHKRLSIVAVEWDSTAQELRPFIWIAMPERQFYIKRNGDYHRVQIDALEHVLTPRQQRVLLTAVENKDFECFLMLLHAPSE